MKLEVSRKLALDNLDNSLLQPGNYFGFLRKTDGGGLRGSRRAIFGKSRRYREYGSLDGLVC